MSGASSNTPAQSRPSDSSVFTIALVLLLITLVGLGSFAFIACTVGQAAQPPGSGIYQMPQKF